MADLLPSTPDLSGTDDPDPRVVGVDGEDAEATLSALSSETARALLTALHEEPDTASGLAERLDTTLQNVQYHLDSLTEAELIEVVDTAYSEKGREMKVYAPADRPLVIFAGDDEEAVGLRAALRRLLGAVSVLAALSVVVQFLLGDLPLPVARTGGGGDAEAMTTQGAEGGAVDAAATLPPGLLFFLGGLFVLALAAGFWYLRR